MKPQLLYNTEPSVCFLIEIIVDSYAVEIIQSDLLYTLAGFT